MDKMFNQDNKIERKSQFFQSSLVSLEEMKRRGIQYFDISSHLRDLKEGLSSATEEEKDRVMVILKKILLILPPWRNGATFINDNLFDYTYSLEEKEELIQNKERIKESEKMINDEVKKGLSPWEARVKHNEQNIKNRSSFFILYFVV